MRAESHSSGLNGRGMRVIAPLVVVGLLAAPVAGADPGQPDEPTLQAADTSAADRLRLRTARDNPYLLGIGDVLQVTVWREPEISLQAVVRPDGMITVPLIGDALADGHTTEQLASDIAARLKEFLREPRVTVIVVEVRSKYFYVVGEIIHPGSYPLLQPTTVLQGLSLSGGFREFANTKKIYLLRNHNGQLHRVPFRYNEVVQGRNTEQQILLRHGDTIVVP